MSKYKYRAGLGIGFSEKKDIMMMEDMANKGYRPIGLNIFGFYKFEKTQPEMVNYTVDFSNIAICSDEFEDYKEIFNSAGWEHVLCIGKGHWFKAAKGTVPIYTDKCNEVEKYKNIFRQFYKGLLRDVIFSLIFLLLYLTVPIPLLEMIFYLLFSGSIGIVIVMVIGTILSWNKVQKIKK
jgi:Protein of unknown function (DUF2812).